MKDQLCKNRDTFQAGPGFNWLGRPNLVTMREAETILDRFLLFGVRRCQFESVLPSLLV